MSRGLGSYSSLSLHHKYNHVFCEQITTPTMTSHKHLQNNRTVTASRKHVGRRLVPPLEERSARGACRQSYQQHIVRCFLECCTAHWPSELAVLCQQQNNLIISSSKEDAMSQPGPLTQVTHEYLSGLVTRY